MEPQKLTSCFSSLCLMYFQSVDLLLISGGFGMRYHLYSSSNLVCLANERVWYWCGLESLIIGSYVYHLDVIVGMHAMLLI